MGVSVYKKNKYELVRDHMNMHCDFVCVREGSKLNTSWQYLKRDRQTDRQRQRDRDRQIERQTQRQRERDRDRGKEKTTKQTNID